jgi:hypothetical protein
MQVRLCPFAATRAASARLLRWAGAVKGGLATTSPAGLAQISLPMDAPCFRRSELPWKLVDQRTFPTGVVAFT